MSAGLTTAYFPDKAVQKCSWKIFDRKKNRLTSKKQNKIPFIYFSLVTKKTFHHCHFCQSFVIANRIEVAHLQQDFFFHKPSRFMEDVYQKRLTVRFDSSTYLAWLVSELVSLSVVVVVGCCWPVGWVAALLLFNSLSAFLFALEPLPRDVSDETFHLNMLPIQKTFMGGMSLQ